MSTQIQNYPDQEIGYKEPIRVMCETYKVVESVNEKTNKKSVFFEGIAITFGKPTRNRVSYTYESGIKAHETLISKPFLDTHHDDSIHAYPPFGHVIECYPSTNEKNGLPCLKYKVDIDPEETVFIRKAKRGDIAGTSIQVLVSDVTEKEDDFGSYIEANVKEFLELSAVLIPGDGDTSLILVESFNSSKSSTITPDGVFSDKKVLKEEDEEQVGPIRPLGIPIKKQHIYYTPKYGKDGKELIDAIKVIEKPKKMIGKRETTVAFKGCHCPSCGRQMLKDNYENGFVLRCWLCGYNIQ